LAFATLLVWRLRIGACGVGACGVGACGFLALMTATQKFDLPKLKLFLIILAQSI